MTKKIIFSILFLILINFIIWGFICAESKDIPNRIHFFNVGQGDAELVIFGNGKTALIDGGPDGAILEKLDEVLFPKKKIDLVFISHVHEDHFRGILAVLDYYDIGVVFLTNSALRETSISSILKEKNISYFVVSVGDKICIQNDCFSVLWPSAMALPNENDKSMVLDFKSNDLSILLTGDISENSEKIILSQKNVSAKILKVSHHGSKFASSANFLQAVNPLVCVIEVGENNIYGLPSQDAIARLQKYCGKLFRIDERGDLIFGEKDDNLVILQKQ